MEVSPKTFREVEFREKMRGYHPEDVDQFLEQMAAGVEVMQDRLRQALERAQRAEQMAAEAGNSDETLRRTLVLAQRTADLAVQEAREQAARILAAAEQQSQSMTAEAEERSRRMHGEALADVHAELAKLEAVRAQSQQEVDVLNRWAEEHRGHLKTTLQDALAMLDRASVISPAPASTPIELPRGVQRASVEGPTGLPAPPRPEEEAPPVEEPPPPAAAVPEPTADEPPPEAPVGDGAHYQADPPAPPPEAPADEPDATVATDMSAGGQFEDGPDDEALASFFEDRGFGDDRRFGGRLRRRR